MANKKAKSKAKPKTTASKAKKTKAPINKRTTTRVVSAKTVATETKPTKAAKGNVFKRFLSYTLMPNTIRMMALELLGAFVLATTFVLTQGHPMYMMFSVVAVYLVFSHLTGGAFNPALSFGQWITRKICGAAVVLQVIAQFLGGMLALVVLQAFIGAAGADSSYNSAQLLTMQEVLAGKEWYLFAAEMVGTMLVALFLGRVVKAKASNRLEKALAMGAGMFAAMLLAGTVANYASGMSVLNPSILMTLQTFSQEFSGKSWVWLTSIYVIAPLLGGALGYVLSDLLQEKESAKLH